MIDKVGLKDMTCVRGHVLNRTDLSAGQRRRLALALALLENRDILILDEFVADQDPAQRKFFFFTLLPWLKSNGKTVLLSIHDMNWISACDRVVTLRGGSIESITRPAAVAAAVPA
jgi:ABC-type siderophore export system fused ATPase/permease subunit